MGILGKYKNKLIAIALFASFLAMMSVASPVQSIHYEEDPIHEVLEIFEYKMYADYNPLAVKVEIDFIAGWYQVVVEIRVDGEWEYRGELEAGESTPWVSCDGERTDIRLTNDGLDALQYWGTICMYQNR